MYSWLATMKFWDCGYFRDWRYAILGILKPVNPKPMPAWVGRLRKPSIISTKIVFLYYRFFPEFADENIYRIAIPYDQGTLIWRKRLKICFWNPLKLNITKNISWTSLWTEFIWTVIYRLTCSSIEQFHINLFKYLNVRCKFNSEINYFSQKISNIFFCVHSYIER